MKKFLSLVLALVMTMSLVTISAGAKDFADDSKITYDVAVEVMSELKVIDGYTDGAFKPTNQLNRGQAAKILCNMILGPTTASALKADAAPFKDVPANSTFAAYIAYCAKEGIIDGYTDGTFRPAAPLTGYAFMKLLLGALGYDKDIEGYNQPNWSINVAKRALSIGLDKGLTGDFDGTKIVTREEACLFAFNALQADLVEYDGKTTIDVGGTSVTVGASSAKAVTTTQAYGDNIKDESPSTLVVQFGEKYFRDLNRPTSTDDQGRPAHDWKIKSKVIAVEPLTADAVYTSGVSQKDVAKALDLTGTTNLFYYSIDGVVSFSNYGNVDASDDDTDALLSDDGVIMEVYSEDTTGYSYPYGVIINPAIVELVDEGKDDDGRYVKDENGIKYYTAEFSEDDYVEVYYGKDGNAAGDDTVITEMKAAEKQTGKISKISGSKWTIDGTTYSKSKSANEDLYTPTKGDVADFWLDSNGYILRAELNAANVNIEDLALVLAQGPRGVGHEAKLLLADGTKKTVETDKAYASYVGDKVVKFELDDGEYELTDKTTYYGASTYYFTKGAAKITVGTPSGTTALKVDSRTTFVYVDAADNYSAKSYVGYKNAPSFSEATNLVAYKKPGEVAVALVYVYVADAKVSGSSSDVVFFVPEKTSRPSVSYEVDKKDCYSVNAIVNGEWKKLDVEVGSAADTNGITYYGGIGITAVKELKLNSDGQVKAVTIADNSPSFNTNATTSKVKNDVVVINGTPYAYSDKTVVYLVDSNRKGMTTGDVTDIREDDNSTKDPYNHSMVVVDDDDVLTYVVLVKN